MRAKRLKKRSYPAGPLLLAAVNRLLRCGWCGMSDYKRREDASANDHALIVRYTLICLNPNCTHKVKAKRCAMEAEVLFEE